MKQNHKALLAAVAVIGLALTAPAPAAAQSYCDTLATNLRLPKPNFNTPSWQFGACIRNSFDIINSSVPIIGSTATFSQLWVSTISGRNGSGLYVSSYTVFGSSGMSMGHWYFLSSATFANGQAIGGAVTFTSTLTVKDLLANFGVKAATGNFTGGVTAASATVLGFADAKSTAFDKRIRLNPDATTPDIRYTNADGSAFSVGSIEASQLSLNPSGTGDIVSWGLLSARKTLQLTSGEAVTGAPTFTSSVTMRQAAQVDGTLALASGQAVTGAPTFISSVTAPALLLNGTAPSLTSKGGVFNSSVTINQGNVNAVPALSLANLGTNASGVNLDYAGGGNLELGSLPLVNGGRPATIQVTNRGLRLHCDNNAFDQTAGCVYIEQASSLSYPRATLVVRQAAGLTNDLTQWMSSDGVVRASVTGNFNLNLGYGVNAATAVITHAQLSSFTINGIAVTAIGNQVSVAGSIQATNGNLLQTGGNVIQNVTSNLVLRPLDTTGNVRIADNSASGVTTIQQGGGNVGIGTASPASKLHVSSGNFTLDGTGSPTKSWALCLDAGGRMGHCGAVAGDGSCTCTVP